MRSLIGGDCSASGVICIGKCEQFVLRTVLTVCVGVGVGVVVWGGVGVGCGGYKMKVSGGGIWTCVQNVVT